MERADHEVAELMKHAIIVVGCECGTAHPIALGQPREIVLVCHGCEFPMRIPVEVMRDVYAAVLRDALTQGVDATIRPV